MQGLIFYFFALGNMKKKRIRVIIAFCAIVSNRKIIVKARNSCQRQSALFAKNEKAFGGAKAFLVKSDFTYVRHIRRDRT